MGVVFYLLKDDVICVDVIRHDDSVMVRVLAQELDVLKLTR